MRNPADFPKTVYTTQSFVTAVYTVIGIVVYCASSNTAFAIARGLILSCVSAVYCGDYVASPALGSAGPLLKKVCYGIAIPALVVGAVL